MSKRLSKRQLKYLTILGKAKLSVFAQFNSTMFLCIFLTIICVFIAGSVRLTHPVPAKSDASVKGSRAMVNSPPQMASPPQSSNALYTGE